MQDFKNIFFLGIGGIGMSNLARYFNFNQKKVFGYDKTQTPLTNELISEGIQISFEDNLETLSKEINKNETLIVFTPAIPNGSILKNYFLDNDFVIYKRSEILGLITKKTKCLAIAGTHGKTTTSTLLAHLCYDSNQKVSAFLGGISENYQTNFLYKGNEISVVEADEFDRSFLNLHPDFAIITSTDADHLDIYGKAEEVEKSFQDFANLIPLQNKVFIQKSVSLQAKNIFTYSAKEKANYYAENIKIEGFKTIFDFIFPLGIINNLEFNIPGNHNLENAIAALSIALEIGISENDLKKALKSFKGIKRRFSIYELSNNKIYIDDYAHHPTEIDAALKTINDLFPKKRILTVFQPHLFTRTRDFLDNFAKSLENSSDLLLLEIYPARELPIKGINSQVLFDKIRLKNKELCSLEKAFERIKDKSFDVIITLGAGNIDTLINKIKTI